MKESNDINNYQLQVQVQFTEAQRHIIFWITGLESLGAEIFMYMVFSSTGCALKYVYSKKIDKISKF